MRGKKPWKLPYRSTPWPHSCRAKSGLAWRNSFGARRHRFPRTLPRGTPGVRPEILRGLSRLRVVQWPKWRLSSLAVRLGLLEDAATERVVSKCDKLGRILRG